MSSSQSPHSSSRPACPHRPSPRPFDTTSGEGCLLGLAVPFMSARCGIIRPRFSSNRSSPRLLACCPMPINHWGRLCRSVSDCGDDCCVSYLLGYPIRPSVPPPFAPPNRHGERGERRGGLILVLGAIIRSACPFNCVGVGGGGNCISRMGVFNCLPAILRLSGNTRAGYAGRHGVGSRSGSIVSQPASYPMRLRILSPVSLPVAPCRLITCPSNPVSLRSVLSAQSS